MRRGRFTIGILVLLAGCTGGSTGDTAYGEGTVTRSACPSCGGDCESDTVEITARYHTTAPIDYPDRPPAGGPHNPCWTTWGVHTDAVPDDNWVHNLEHGGVVFLYNCPNGCDSDVAQLTSYVQSLDNRGVLTPYPDMDWQFAAVAWGYRLLLGCLDLPAMEQFESDHVNQAPEQDTAEPPSTCERSVARGVAPEDRRR